MFHKGWKLAPGTEEKNVSFMVVLFFETMLKNVLTGDLQVSGVFWGLS